MKHFLLVLIFVQISNQEEDFSLIHKREKRGSCSQENNGETATEAEVIVENSQVDGGESVPESVPRAPSVCMIHKQCATGEVCTKSGLCKSVTCQSDADCSSQINLPAKCQSRFPGTPKFCDPETTCESTEDCAKAGAHFRCDKISEQCKPSWGDCEITCDCFEQYGMILKQAICTNTVGGEGMVCMCRGENVAMCNSTQNKIVTTPQPTSTAVPTTTPEVIIETTGPADPGSASTTTTEPPTEPPTEIATEPPVDPGSESRPDPTCPPPNEKPPGKEGDSCVANTACAEPLQLICVKKPSEKVGKCAKVKCSGDGECTSATSLPSQCFGGFCADKECYEDEECPDGYACDDAGHCKRNLGSCQFECDCSDCDPTKCFRGHCFCMADHDSCNVAAVTVTATHLIDIATESAVTATESAVDGGTAVDENKGLKNRTEKFKPIPNLKYTPPKQNDEKCAVTKCPDGFEATPSGCYSLEVTESVDYQSASSTCSSKGGYLAEITTRKENKNLIYILKQKKIPIWMGLQKREDKFMWGSGKPFDYYPCGYDKKAKGDCVVRVGQKFKNVDCSQKKKVLCEVGPDKLNTF